MESLIFGYMRVPEDLPDDEVRHREAAMRTYARKEGLDLVAIFHEVQPSRFSAYEELLGVLRKTKASRVVVPAYEDFAVSYHLQNALVLRVQHGAGAQVIALDEL